ncbi:MAG TPA: hypothetical protein VE994_04435 [Terriglobales bacterium]|nr:hypothetical protein [Terriglobales bacterium]
MTEKKKREKVTAEISVTHLIQFARELGEHMSREEAIAFLNRDGRAYGMWQQMMHAAEDYVKRNLKSARGRTRVETQYQYSSRPSA